MRNSNSSNKKNGNNIKRLYTESIGNRSLPYKNFRKGSLSDSESRAPSRRSYPGPLRSQKALQNRISELPISYTTPPIVAFEVDEKKGDNTAAEQRKRDNSFEMSLYSLSHEALKKLYIEYVKTYQIGVEQYRALHSKCKRTIDQINTLKHTIKELEEQQKLIEEEYERLDLKPEKRE